MGPAGSAGLLERSTAADSLEAVAEELVQAKPAMLSFVPPAEHHIVESFFSRTVQAAGGTSASLASACDKAYASCTRSSCTSV